MKLKAIRDQVIVSVDATESTSNAGILLVKRTDHTHTGTVTSVGPEDTQLSEGDKILFIKGTGKRITLDEQQYTVLATSQVVGKLNNELEPLSGVIVCINADFGDQITDAGIVIKNNLHLSQGITARWMQVYAVGPDCDFLTPGQWVLVNYGRWTESFAVDGHEQAYRVDPDGCAAVSDTKPNALYYNSDVVVADKKML